MEDFGAVQTGDDVLVSGYPTRGLSNGIDFDTEWVERQRFNAMGHYLQRDTSKWLHRIQLEMGIVPSLQGMSGSPVFLSRRDAGQWRLAGILLRGNDKGLAHFVEARVAYFMIVKHCTAKP